MKLSDDKALFAIFKVLISEIKKKANNGTYPIFPPSQIEIIKKGEIKFQNNNGADNLRECLKHLGVTLYHLATGESEINKASYKMDGYTKNIDSKLWPAMQLMLSGEAYDISQVEKAASGKKEEWKKIKEKMEKIRLSAKEKFQKISQIIMPWLKNGWKKIFATNNILVFLMIIGIIEVVEYWIFNWNFSSGEKMFLATILAVVGVGGSALLYDDTEWAGIVLIAGVLLAYGFSSWIFNKDELVESSSPVLLVERETGRIVARLDKTEDKSLPKWEKDFINHLKYEVIATDFMGVKKDEIAWEDRKFYVEYETRNYKQAKNKYGNLQEFKLIMIPKVEKDIEEAVRKKEIRNFWSWRNDLEYFKYQIYPADYFEGSFEINLFAARGKKIISFPVSVSYKLSKREDYWKVLERWVSSKSLGNEIAKQISNNLPLTTFNDSPSLAEMDFSDAILSPDIEEQQLAVFKSNIEDGRKAAGEKLTQYLNGKLKIDGIEINCVIKKKEEK